MMEMDEYVKQYDQWLLDQVYYINTTLPGLDLQTFARHRMLLEILVAASKVPSKAAASSIMYGTTASYNFGNALAAFFDDRLFNQPLFLDWLIVDNEVIKPTRPNLDARIGTPNAPWRAIEATPFLMTGDRAGGNQSPVTFTLGWLVKAQHPQSNQQKDLYIYFDIGVEDDEYDLRVITSEKRPKNFSKLLNVRTTRETPRFTLLPVSSTSKALWSALWPNDGPKVGNFLFDPMTPILANAPRVARYYTVGGVFGVSHLYEELANDISGLLLLFEPEQDKGPMLVSGGTAGQLILNHTYQTVGDYARMETAKFRTYVSKPLMAYDPVNAQLLVPKPIASTPVKDSGIEDYIRNATPFGKWLLRHMRYAESLANDTVLQTFVFHRMLLTIFATMFNNGGFKEVDSKEYVSKVQSDPVFEQDFYFDYITNDPLKEPTTAILQNNTSRYRLSNLTVGGLPLEENIFGRTIYSGYATNVSGQEKVSIVCELALVIINTADVGPTVVVASYINLPEEVNFQVQSLNDAKIISIVPFTGEFSAQIADFLFRDEARNINAFFATATRLIDASYSVLKEEKRPVIAVENLNDIRDTLLQLFVPSRQALSKQSTYILQTFVQDDLLTRYVDAIPPLPSGINEAEKTLRSENDALSNQMEGIVSQVYTEGQRLANISGEAVDINFASDQETEARMQLSLAAQAADLEQRFGTAVDQSSNLRAALAERTQQLRDYSTRVSVLEAELAAANTKLEEAIEVQEEYNAAMQNRDALIQEYQTLDATRKAIQAEKEGLEEERQAMYEHEGALQTQYRTELEAAGERIATLEASIRQNEAQRAELEAAGANNQSLVVNLQSQIDDIEDELKASTNNLALKETEITALNIQLRQKDTEIASLRSSLMDASAALESQAKQYESQGKRYESEITKLQATITQGNTNLLELQKERNELQSSLQKSEAFVDNIKGQLAQLEASYRSEIQTLEASYNKLLASANRDETLALQLSEARDKVSRTEAELAKTRQDTASKSLQLQELQRRMDQANKSTAAYESMKTKNDELYQQLQESRAAVTNLQSELATRNSMLTSLKQQAETSRVSTSSTALEIERLRSAKDELDRQLARERDSAAQTLQRAEERRTTAQTALSDIQRELANVKLQLQEAKLKVAEDSASKKDEVALWMEDFKKMKAERDQYVEQLNQLRLEKRAAPARAKEELTELQLRLVALGTSIVNGLKLQIIQNTTNFLATRQIQYRSPQAGAAPSEKAGYKWLTPALLYSQGMSKPYADNLLRAVQ